jgi:hypothetical protein
MRDEVVQEEDAVEVVNLVLDGLGKEEFSCQSQLAARFVQRPRLDLDAARDQADVLGDAQTPLVNLTLALTVRDLGVDHDARLLPRHLEDYEPLEYADLVGSEADPARVLQGLDHVPGQLTDAGVHDPDLPRPLAQEGVRDYADGEEGHAHIVASRSS